MHCCIVWTATSLRAYEKTDMQKLERMIEQAFDNRATGLDDREQVEAAVQEALALLDAGKARVAEKIDGKWQVNQWLKKAVLLSFGLNDNEVIESGHSRFYDKVPMKYAGYTRFFDKVPLKYAQTSADEFAASGTRVVPDAIVRRGACIAPNVVLMPSYVNIGAYVDSGSMIDTWATVGSCAQIGKNVHLSGGAGIGGVLEPLQAAPTIIEDDCFIGARSEVVEGVIVEKGSVIAMGVFLSQSTRIYDRTTGETIYGRVPAGSVVVPGSLPADDGSYSLACAVIVKRVDERTRAKTSLNDLLRPD